MIKATRVERWFFYLLFCVSLALTWFFHKDASRFNDRHELWSDRAGYYIYLPASWFYHFNAREMPADLDMSTGGGFSNDTTRNRIETKYTYGVALMQSPFFVAAGLVSRIAGYDSEHGFSMLYMRMMSLAAVVYLLLGLWFLKRFLDHYFTQAVSFFTILLIYAGTNLFYYSLIDGMMSHVFSFFLFSLFLFSLQRFHDTQAYRWFLLLCLVFSVAVLIRPTNILLGGVFLAWDAALPSASAPRPARFRLLLQPKYLVSLAAILFLVFLPQLVYWKYVSGNWFYFSYHDEGFTNWRHPMIAQVLFSPVNGLFTHTPLALLMVAGILLMLFLKKQNGWTVAALFVAVTLVCASWKMWFFGCSFGQRSYVEYYAVLAVPLAILLTKVISGRSFILRTLVFFLIFLAVYFNLRYTVVLYRFDRCYFGSTWDWDHYIRSIRRAGILSPAGGISAWENDFENLALFPTGKVPSRIFTRSGTCSVGMKPVQEMIMLYSLNPVELGYPWPKRMEVGIWCLKPGSKPTGAMLEYALTRGNDVLFSDRQPFDDMLREPVTWGNIRKTFIIPELFDTNLRITVFLRNPEHALLYADDLSLRYRYNWN